ncbi:MAG: S41 family peptidase [Candidatus Pacebacteria bacterium]|nr:S41 family peptidase [Candidatus Paceibacterota bacterium]MDR3582785.1 S41 family peptidase [Candidatus Paceibacterota bacterium]
MTEENFSNNQEEKNKETENRKPDLSDIEQENLEKNRKLFKKYVIFFAVIILVVSSFYFGYNRGRGSVTPPSSNIPLDQSVLTNKNSPTNDQVDFSLFWKVWDLLKEKHVDKDKLNAQQLVYGAINGMLAATNDPYTEFFDPEQNKEFSQDIGGSFEGIGAELGVKDKILTVIAPLDGSPAQKAGLRSGDKILKVNGQSISNMSIDQAVNLIRGPKGSKVTLTIFREGDQNTQDIAITRDTIEVKSVNLSFKDNGIAYLQITQFSSNTSQEFDDAMNQIIAHQSKGIILDLRDDPGGLLDQAVDVADRLISKGQIVVTEKDSAGKEDSTYTTGGDKLSSLPLVVLINQGSASASEILSGALKDDRNITLVGQTSFGKGCVQEFLDLPGGSSVKITVANWLTPHGDYIMNKGITPTIKVDMTADDTKNNKDPQLDKAMQVLESQIK